jgi:hypothetical protein
MRRRCGTIVSSEIQSSRVQEWQTLLLREFEPRHCHRCCRLAPVAIDSEPIRSGAETAHRCEQLNQPRFILLVA